MLTRKRVGWTLAVAAVVMLAVFFRYYTVIQAEEESVVQSNVNKAVQAGAIASVVRSETYIGDQAYTIVYGRNKDNQDAIVWVNENELITKLAAEGKPAQDVQAQTQAKGSDIEILRVSPGRLQNVLLWEVFYKKPEAGGERYYYDYYRFEDGVPIDTYKLSVR